MKNVVVAMVCVLSFSVCVRAELTQAQIRAIYAKGSDSTSARPPGFVSAAERRRLEDDAVDRGRQINRAAILEMREKYTAPMFLELSEAQRELEVAREELARAIEMDNHGPMSEGRFINPPATPEAQARVDAAARRVANAQSAVDAYWATNSGNHIMIRSMEYIDAVNAVKRERARTTEMARLADPNYIALLEARASLKAEQGVYRSRRTRQRMAETGGEERMIRSREEVERLKGVVAAANSVYQANRVRGAVPPSDRDVAAKARLVEADRYVHGDGWANVAIGSSIQSSIQALVERNRISRTSYRPILETWVTSTQSLSSPVDRNYNFSR